MKIPKLAYEPRAALDFYADALSALGAVAEQSWHDKLEVLAEGRAAEPWNPDGSMYSGELLFAAPDNSQAREAAREVFPGCPLTFRLAESVLREGGSLPLERFILGPDADLRAPDAALAERRWRAEQPGSGRWRLASPFTAGFHFSLLALVRCEIQAIDQHWSLHRTAINLATGERDEALAAEAGFAKPLAQADASLRWPSLAPGQIGDLLRRAVQDEIEADLAAIRVRQESLLRRELLRIDTYFADYKRELSSRSRRGDPAKISERLAAAEAEHRRRRADQASRHEIRVLPHVDALIMVAEPAWHAQVEAEVDHRVAARASTYIPRLRSWAPG